MKKNIIIAGFTAIGKTTLATKYPNTIIDLESSLYQWNYPSGLTLSEIEQNKGKKQRIPNKDFPSNYINAIQEAQKNYAIVLTSMHWDLLDYFEQNQIEYYLAYPRLDSGETLQNRCVKRGNALEWAQKINEKVCDWHPKLTKYHPKKILTIPKDQYLEDILIQENLF